MLNVQSQFFTSEVDKVRQRSSRPQLEELPTMEAVIEATAKLKAGKAGGSSAILPEMIVHILVIIEYESTLSIELAVTTFLWDKSVIISELSTAIISLRMYLDFSMRVGLT